MAACDRNAICEGRFPASPPHDCANWQHALDPDARPLAIRQSLGIQTKAHQDPRETLFSGLVKVLFGICKILKSEGKACSELRRTASGKCQRVSRQAAAPGA